MVLQNGRLCVSRGLYQDGVAASAGIHVSRVAYFIYLNNGFLNIAVLNVGWI